nr:hypothetical protein CFP56_21091 [Quercus suber]
MYDFLPSLRAIPSERPRSRSLDFRVDSYSIDPRDQARPITSVCELQCERACLRHQQRDRVPAHALPGDRARDADRRRRRAECAGDAGPRTAGGRCVGERAGRAREDLLAVVAAGPPQELGELGALLVDRGQLRQTARVPVARQALIGQWAARAVQIFDEELGGALAFRSRDLLELGGRHGRIDAMHADATRRPLDRWGVQVEEAALLKRVRHDRHEARISPGELAEPDDREQQILIGVGGELLADATPCKVVEVWPQLEECSSIAGGFRLRVVGGAASGEHEHGLRVGLARDGSGQDVRQEGLVVARFADAGIRALKGNQRPVRLIVDVGARVDGMAAHDDELGRVSQGRGVRHGDMLKSGITVTWL